MRQVPALDASPFGIVGNGRVASHFQHYLHLLGLPVRAWARRVETRPPHDALSMCRTVLLLIPDTAIVPFIEAWPALREKRLVHCSGSLVTPIAEAAHPLMTFGPELYDLPDYEAIPFILDDGGTPFAELLPGLANPAFSIPAADRPYYHALCVMAGNFSTLLWVKLFDELQQRFDIPPSAAHPYLGRVTANMMVDAGRALTGPLSRGDADTIASNLKSLDGDPFQAVYAAFVRAYEQRA
jgi:predicted short-subunit dehydrogenase-like oxidoreductase (DUF2520 family)